MIDINQIESLIPQRHPFLMLDRVTELEEGKFIKAYKNISINEEYFKGHFPGAPVFPGALTGEALAQAACILIKKSVKDLKATLFYVTGIKIRFFKTVSPGDQLLVFVKAVKMGHVGGVFEVEASVGNDQVAKGEMTFACK